MDISNILIPVAIFGILGIIVGSGLGFASIKLKVEEDERLPDLLDALPSANCGGCGFAGCGAFANALVKGTAQPNGCPVGGQECAAALASILGIEHVEADKEVAFVNCIGSCSVASNKYDYVGLNDCTAMSYLPAEGAKSCEYGCLGGASCFRACPFGAIEMKDNIATILPDKCVGCGVCVETCPKSLIDIKPYGKLVTVGCSSRDVESVVKNNCSVGCISCHECHKACGFEAIKIEDNLASIVYANCTNCNNCVVKCPTSAIRQRVPAMYNAITTNSVEEVKAAIADPDKIVVVSSAPAVRVALAEMFGHQAGTWSEGKMISALRKLGADYVLDIDFSADMTIMEEASELLDRITNGGTLPMLTSCCPNWVDFMEREFPGNLEHLSSAKSPILMQGATVKSYWAKEQGIDPSKIVNITLAPCDIKKFEIDRKEFNDAGKIVGNENMRDMDICFTTTEFGNWIKEEGIDFDSLEESTFDEFMGVGSGAGLIFGSTGGVMEAAARTAYYMVTGNNPDPDFLKETEVRGFESSRTATMDLGGTEIKVAVVYGLDNARKLMDEIKAGTAEFHFMEVMSCRGGCISGPGQPSVGDEGRLARVNALRGGDQALDVRLSYENPAVKEAYAKYFDKPLSHKAHDLLHTAYGKNLDNPQKHH